MSQSGSTQNGQITVTTNSGSISGNNISLVGDSNIQTSGSSTTITISSAGSVKTKSSTYTALSTDSFILCTSNSFTITLPSPSSLENKIYNIKNSGSGIVTVATTGSEKIDGEDTQQIHQDESLTLITDSTNWYIT